MNGSTNGHTTTANEVSSPHANGNTALLSQIHEALKLVHAPYSSNQSRQQASSFLENIKAEDEAPYHGFTLASDKSQEPVVRHYALSLLEHAIKHKWAAYSEGQASALRQWVIQLSENLAQEDPSYLRNKTAQLWVEIAKRSWGSEWIDMDKLLVGLWELPGTVVYKEFVLFVLETLSDEVFNGEDAVTVLREGALSKACVEIFTPAVVLSEAFPNRQLGTVLRHGEEGWLVRIGGLLGQCLQLDISSPQYQSCAVKILAVYKSVVPWTVPKAISSAQCVQYMCKCLAAPSTPVQLASVQALFALYSRVHFSDEEFLELVCPMYTSEVVGLLRNLFQWSVVDANDIDDEKYLFAKKFSEMMSNLGVFIESKISAIPESCDLSNLLNLFLAIAQSQSLVVSIPIILTWTKLLRSPIIGGSSFITPLIAPLLELSSSRLIRYENMPDDCEDAEYLFLQEDIDTQPERHAFLGNYRRYCSQIIELIVRQKQSEAIYHILSQVDNSLQHLYDGCPPFSGKLPPPAHPDSKLHLIDPILVENYSKTSIAVLRVDKNFTVVEAALKGYMKWRAGHGSDPQRDVITRTARLTHPTDYQQEQERTSIEDNLETWCQRLLELKFEDPIIQKRIIQLVVAFSTTALDKKVGFMLKVLEHILMTQPTEYPNASAYTEAVKELQAESAYELQRLAGKMPDQLLDVYDQLQAKVDEIISTRNLDKKRQTSYQTFLFTIIHRNSKIDPEIRLQKLQGFLTPVQASWQNSEMNHAVEGFPGFCDLLGLNRVRDFLVTRRVHEIQDWSTYQLDSEAQSIQKDMEERLKALPLRTTKSFLGCSTEKLEKEDPAYKVSCTLWRDALPIILPTLLRYLSHAHAFHNPANWNELPPEMAPIVGRILTDRFWQSGISVGSKDDFYARVTGTKSTMEGLASSIRGSIRTVRESCYSILYSMSRLDVDFYGFSELPGPLANALFADAHCLSSHQLIALLNVVRLMVDDCPVEVRSHFVPPILASCFAQMDAKCSSEWERLSHKEVVPADGDTLTEEMKEESILRQLTHTSVMMIAGFLDPARPNIGSTPAPRSAKEASTFIQSQANSYPSMRKFCLTSQAILESLLLFLTHAIRMRDTRCCGVVLRVFRSIVPEFSSGNDSSLASSIREFISTEVLKAAISSLNEPYFVELQKDLASLIASILAHYAPVTDTPKQILLSLPGIQEKAVNKCIEALTVHGVQQRTQRALILDLLKDLKGVSISEQGRISKSASVVRKERSKMQEAFMRGPVEDNRKVKSEIDDLEGVAGLFDN
ncbi:hypothetical protein BGAL_0196g00160 [Botrytis galanthina]|uniref:Exportin-5 C-terminal domain-containing protein n=1 Tax=Botrytis galanthina TaxID=278940 RepID=A0A4S8QVY0_9HELO|nr:hypothetical protein BGAL_0196g00160 [Botrytis galanthina]